MATTSRSARYAKWLSIPLGLVISALLIWQASYAAFTDEVRSDGNSWTAGSVTLESDDVVDMVFDEQNLVRGETDFRDITVVYTGSLDAEVMFYGEDNTSTKEFGKNITLLVEGSDGDEFNPAHSGIIYEGPLSAFPGIGTPFRYDVSGNTDRSGSFRFTYTVNKDAEQTVQGGEASINFVLQSRSKPKA